MGYVKNKEKVDITHENNKHADAVQNALNYAENIDKTLFSLDGDEDILVSGYMCTPETAALQFQMDKDLYHSIHGYRNLGTKTDQETGEVVDKQSVDAYHIIQSFEYDKTLDPRLVHKLGLEFAERAFPGHRCISKTMTLKSNLQKVMNQNTQRLKTKFGIRIIRTTKMNMNVKIYLKVHQSNGLTYFSFSF